MAKGKAEKHDEQVQFAAYRQFCDDTTRLKTEAITEANERIDVLAADHGAYKLTVDPNFVRRCLRVFRTRSQNASNI